VVRQHTPVLPSVLRMASAVSMGLLSIRGRRRRFERDAASKASKLGKGNQQPRASERRGRSQGVHGYWLNGLGRCVCGCVAVVWVVG
jgi:hypothetical protein